MESTNPNSSIPKHTEASEEVTSQLIWDDCLKLAENEDLIPRAFVKSSLTQVETAFAENSQFLVYAPHDIQRINQEYTEPLSECLAKVCEKFGIEPLELQILKSRTNEQFSFDENVVADSNSASGPASIKPYKPLGKTELKPTYTFDNFVAGDGASRLPLEAFKTVAEAPGEMYNPIFIYGDVGLGKTHLLHAVAHYVRKHFPDYIVRYSTTNQFLSDFVTAVSGTPKDMGEFRNFYRNVDVFLLDDIQFLTGKDATKNEIFDTLNDLYIAGKQIVLAADRQPKALEDIPERLQTRFMSGLVLDIKPPDFETRIAILRLKTGNLYTNFEISDETYEFIAENFTQNIRELEGALTRLIAQAQLDNRERESDAESFYINLPYAQDALQSMLGSDWNKELTPTHIIEICADYLHCAVEELIGPRRSQQITTARHIAMYVMREITDLSFPQIGDVFGGRDHSTVMHAIRKKVEPQLKEDTALLNQVNELLRILKTKDLKFIENTNSRAAS